MPDLPNPLQKIFPTYHTTDSSKPDPGYKVPPPPICTLSPDGDELEEAVVTGKTDGLQEIPKVKTFKILPDLT